MKKTLKNLGYQTIYQILAICIPLITSPYLSRILGAEGLGDYSYSYSVVNYFILFAMLGTVNYGSRSVSISKDNKENLAKTFWSIYALQLICALFSVVSYLFFVKLFAPENLLLYYIQMVWILACVLDISWFFFGIENFKVTVIRNIFVKIITVIALFIFVKESGDVWKYALIMSLGTLLSQLSLWPFLSKYIYFFRPHISDICEHVYPNIKLFIPILGLSVYHIMDKTMLGMFSNSAESGYYYNADKVMSIPLTIILATGNVMLPRMTELVLKGNVKEENHVFAISIEGFMSVTIGMAFGMVAIAPDFIPIFFGKGYEPCVRLVYIFALIMIFKALSSIIRDQFLIPHKYEKRYSISVFWGAIANLISNIVFVFYMRMGAMGACLGTLVAEFLTCIICVGMVNRETNLLKNLIKVLYYFCAGVVMFICVRVFSQKLEISVASLFFQIILGGILYLASCIVNWILNKKSSMHNVISEWKIK